MFSSLQNRLTSYSNNYIDWSRVGELLQSGTHQYSLDELLTRGLIITCTAVSAYLGYSLNDENRTQYSSLATSIASGLLGFTLSHAIVIYPLIKKRYEMSKECNDIKSEIEKVTASSPSHSYKDTIDNVVNEIFNLSLSDEKHSRASQTWGRRKSLLSKLFLQVKTEEATSDFWKQEPLAIIDALNNNLISNQSTHSNRSGYTSNN